MGRALSRGGATKGLHGVLEKRGCGKRQRQHIGIDPNRCPGRPTSPTPHCGAKGGGERGDGEAECVHTHCTRTRAHTWL